MVTFTTLHSIKDIEYFIRDYEMSFLYLSQPNCSVCHGLLPQVSRMLSKYPQIRAAEVNTLEVPEVASRFSVLTIPVLLLFVNGKEYIREARIVHTAKLNEKINKIYHYIINAHE